MRNPFSVCIVLFRLLVCCFLFNILHKPAPVGAVAFPSPPPHAKQSLQAVISKAGLGYFWECHSLVIH